MHTEGLKSSARGGKPKGTDMRGIQKIKNKDGSHSFLSLPFSFISLLKSQSCLFKKNARGLYPSRKWVIKFCIESTGFKLR